MERKTIIVILLILSTLISFGQTKVYQSNSSIKILGTDTVNLITGQVNYTLNGGYFRMYDNINKQSIKLGRYGDITRQDGSGFANTSAAMDYLDSIVNLQVTTVSTASANTTVEIDSPLDNLTNAVQIIDYEHHEIHGGSHYFYADTINLDANESSTICIDTPDETKWTHLVFVANSTLGSQVLAYESSTVTFDGEELTAANNNRNSSNTSNWDEFERDPTVTAWGTQLPSIIQLGSATNPNQGLPGQANRDRELVLKQNDNTCFFIKSLNNNNVITFLLEWYEHTNK